jgi:hypothetical protein
MSKDEGRDCPLNTRIDAKNWGGRGIQTFRVFRGPICFSLLIRVYRRNPWVHLLLSVIRVY